MLIMGFHQPATLLAMVLAIGIVVDDAIIVLENIHRHIEDGCRRAMRASRRARTRLAGGGDDHTTGRGLSADRLPGRPHRCVVHRVRVHLAGSVLLSA